MEFNNRTENDTYYVSTDRQLFWPIWLVDYYYTIPSSDVNVGDTFICINNEVIKVNK